MPFWPESAFVLVAIFSPSLLIFPWQIQYKPICVTCNCASESGSSEPLNLFQFIHVNSSLCNHADASPKKYHPYQRWRFRSVTPSKFRSCSRDTIPSTALKILRIVKGASNFVGVDVVVERRNCWLALSSEGRGPVCCGHETDRVWFTNSKRLKNTYQLSSCLFFGSGWEHFLMMQNLWGASFHKNPMLKNDWCWREFPNLHRQTASRLPAVQLLM